MKYSRNNRDENLISQRRKIIKTLTLKLISIWNESAHFFFTFSLKLFSRKKERKKRKKFKLISRSTLNVLSPLLIQIKERKLFRLRWKLYHVDMKSHLIIKNEFDRWKLSIGGGKSDGMREWEMNVKLNTSLGMSEQPCSFYHVQNFLLKLLSLHRDEFIQN